MKIKSLCTSKQPHHTSYCTSVSPDRPNLCKLILLTVIDGLKLSRDFISFFIYDWAYPLIWFPETFFMNEKVKYPLEIDTTN